MDVPAPVNLNALKGILAKSKQVMAKAENGAINENIDRDFEKEFESNPVFTEQTVKVPTHTKEQIMASNLPSNIKEALLRDAPSEDELRKQSISEDFSELEDINMTPNKKPIRETIMSNKSDMITISKSDLKELVNEQIVGFLRDSYEKRLTEETIKRTISLLIKEGKLNVTKKKI